VKLPQQYLLSELLSHNVRKNMTLSYGVGETVWMHPPVHRILGWSSRPSNLNLRRNVWRLNQIRNIIDGDVFVQGEPAISDLNTLNRFPNLLFANLINKNGLKIGSIADFIFDFKTGNILNYLISRSNPRIPGSSRWKLNIKSITDQQPGLVFCSEESLNDFILVKSSIKNEFLKKGKNLFNKFDDIKNIATNKLEDWLEEDEVYETKIMPEDDQLLNKNNKINSNANKPNYSNNRDNDPWI